MSVYEKHQERKLIRSAAERIIATVLDRPMRPRTQDTRGGMRAPPPLENFQHMEPLGFGLPQEGWWMFHPEDCHPSVVWPLTSAAITDKDDGNFFMSKSRTITAKEVRGVATRFSPYMVRQDYGTMLDGVVTTGVSISAYIGGKWCAADGGLGYYSDNGVPDRIRLTEQDMMQVNLATGIALRQRYEWAVSLGFERTPSIRFATDPTGLKDLMRIRDVPEGRDRREMLMTWISDHWRQTRHDPDIEGYVRKHLRGSTKFSWSGMIGTVIPSAYDMEQQEKLIDQRAVMKVAGTDKRLKA